MKKDVERKARDALSDLNRKAAELRKALRGGVAIENLRGSERDRKRAERSVASIVSIPRCDDRARREQFESDSVGWLQWYCADLFWYPFTEQQREMIHAIEKAIQHGGDQAIAASRGEGKTKIFERTLLKAVLSGAVKFALLCAATGSRAEDSLESIKETIATNDRLRSDYPEVCVPVRALENTPNRAHYQRVRGNRHDNDEPFTNIPSRFVWCGQEVYLPNVPGSPSAGAIIATRGLDAEVRGLNKRDRRPDVVCIDDPDTEETANSEVQAAKLEKRIDRSLAGLGGQQRGVSRVMITTIQNRNCISYRFTDRKLKPAWKGRRFRFLAEPPARIDLWDEYVMLRRADMEQGDEYARRAHRFYTDHREQMDAAAVVGNPNRFDGRELDDGTQLEISALQRYFNEVARIGQEAVSCEYDNNPPEEDGPQESGISAYRVQKKVNGFQRKEVPPGCTVITQGIDVRKVALHFVVRAWRPDGTGFTIDYGVQEVLGVSAGGDEGLDAALQRSLHARREAVESDPYVTGDGQVVPLGKTLVDSGWRTDAIYRFCANAGLGYSPSKGCGKSAGCAVPNFYAPVHSNQDKKIGHRWFLSRQSGNVWLVMIDADHWKAWEHDRWMSDPAKPGSLTLWGDPSPTSERMSHDEKSHFSYAKHIVSEVEVEEVVKGQLKRRWKSKSDNNHYLDASTLADVAASMEGVIGGPVTLRRRAPGNRPTLAQLAGRS